MNADIRSLFAICVFLVSICFLVDIFLNASKLLYESNFGKKRKILANILFFALLCFLSGILLFFAIPYANKLPQAELLHYDLIKK
jgi:uncharacterized membrane protein